MSNFSSNANVLPPYAGPKDPVLALALLDVPHVAATLHRSGRVCIFACDAGMYVFVSEVFLPCKLSTASDTTFLLSGPDATLLALVLADEHPKTDSLRVFELAVADIPGNPYSLTCRQLVNREGPIPPIIAACYFAEDIIIATRSGTVTALLHEPRYSPRNPQENRFNPISETVIAGVEVELDSPRPYVTSRKGLPGRTLWTAIDDVDEPFGLGRAIDALQLNDHDVLLNADRFSSKAIAKALRLPVGDEITRDFVCNALSQINIADQDGGLNRLRQRAEQYMKLEDLRVRDLSWDESIGLIIAREKGIYVMRPLFEAEKRVFTNYSDLLACDQDTPHGTAAWMLASHAMCQNVAAQFVDGATRTDDISKLSFIFKLVIRSSESNPAASLLQSMCHKRAEDCIGLNISLTFPEVIEDLSLTLQPGTTLLTTLMTLNEPTALGEAALQCATLLPVSTAFSSGYCWVQNHLREAEVLQNTDNELNEEERRLEERVDVSNLNKAFGFFSVAAQTFLDGATLEDTLCAFALAGFPSSGRFGVKDEKVLGDSLNWREWEIGPPPGDEDVENIKLGACSYWLSERAARLFDDAGVPRIAASMELEAMKYAPDYAKYEQMRAKAFKHFLEIDELENALSTILNEPFEGAEVYDYRRDDDDALKDSIGEFINKAAELKKLKWLADQSIPEPLSSLCGQALERRARSSKPLDIYKMEGESWYAIGNGEFLSCDSDGCEYGDLISWHILRNDEISAASCALEWAERLDLEGQEIICDTVKLAQEMQSGIDGNELCLRYLITWIESKLKALSWVQSAMNVSKDSQGVTRSRVFRHASEEIGNDNVVVDIRWVARRLLLSYVQRRYLREGWELFSNGNNRNDNIDHLKSEWSLLLSEGKSGVRWVSSRLREKPTYENFLLCVELCAAWWTEVGDEPLVEAVADAARAAPSSEIENFGYKDLQRLLSVVVSSCNKCGMGKRNWYTLALRKTLSTCDGRASCPKWLIDASAHGVSERRDGGRVRQGVKGDILGTVHALLENNRPVDAANVLMSSLSEAEESIRDGGRSHVSFTAIDAALEILLQTAVYYPEAEKAYKLLSTRAEDYISAVQERQRELKELQLEHDSPSRLTTPSSMRKLKHSADDMDVIS